MLYKKLTIEFKEHPRRLSRVLLVRSDIDLFSLGVAIVVSLGGMFEHYFLFRNKTHSFLPENFDQCDDDELFMAHFHLSDLGDQFSFEYDTGDGWDFHVKVSEQSIEKRSRKWAHVIDGVGQGIWEDNIRTLLAYLDGEIAADFSGVDEALGYTLPWNFHNQTVGDFDQPLDIVSLEETFNSDFLDALEQLEESDYF